MYTFEDVDFLINYLRFVSSVNLIDKILYAHTNNLLFNSASYNNNGSYRLMFGFLNMSRKFHSLCVERGVKYNRGHFLACYYSITFIRLAINIISFSEFSKLYFFIKKRIRSKLIISYFKTYNPKLAGGRLMIKNLIIHNQPLLLTLYLFFIAIKRYR